MARKTKEKTKKINEKNKRGKVEEEKNTKDEKFSFDEEIFIGLKRIEEDKPKVDKSANNANKKKGEKKNNVKAKQGAMKNVKQENERQSTKINVNVKKTKNNVPQKKLTPKQEIARKKRKAILRIVKFTTLLLIVLGGTIYTLLSPIFNIKTISVIGNSEISIDEIISLSGLELEQNMFQYRQADVVKQIKENAYIDTVKIKRKVPDTVEIVISEREASYMVQFANAYAYINNQGYILEITDKKENLPIITGIETIQENIQTGNRLCAEDLKKLGDVLKIMESSESNELSEYITKIDITNSDNYILTLQEKNKIVHLGDTSNLSTKMLWILKFNELEGDVQGEIILNMNLNDDKNKPYFRKKI